MAENPSRSSDLAGTKFPALTGLRWVAAFCVWLHHFPPPVDMPPWAARFLRELHIGVPVFFVLSGFLITLRYSEKAAFDRRWLGRYARNRVARIYPVYFLVTLISLVVAPIWSGEAIYGKVLFLNLTLLRGFFDDYKFSGVPQGWTLTVEECFYFLAPLFFLLWRRWRGGLWTTLALIYLAGLALWGIGEQLEFHGFFSPFRFVAAYTFFGQGFSFIAGAWLARRFLNGGFPETRNGFPWITLAGALGIVVSVVLLSRGQSESHAFGHFNPPYSPLYFFAIPVAVCALIAGLCLEGGWVARLLGSRVFVLLGEASFCFYLIHLGMHQVLHSELPNALPADGYWFELLGIVLLSIALYLCFEKPLNRWLRGRPRGRRRRRHRRSSPLRTRQE